MAEREERASYVRMDNATLVKMNFAKLAKDFSKYSQLMIDIKKLNDNKRGKRKEYIEKLKVIEHNFNELVKMLPKVKEKEHIIKEIERHEPRPKVEDVESEVGTFAELRDEFERLRSQLEDLKGSI